MKKETAVEWLIDNLPANIIFYNNEVAKLFAKAKNIENENIVFSYSNGWHDGQDVIINQIKHIDFGGDNAGSKFYEETYRKDEKK